MQRLDKNQLTNLLQFKNEDIISRFTDMYKIEAEEINDIFTETLKFLYISQVPGVFIPDDLLIIDKMWHNMILFTPEYHAFSKAYFNTPYFHHVPASKKEKEDRMISAKKDSKKAKEDYLQKLEFLIIRNLRLFRSRNR
ncbi:glycine-rich domain-containing protein [Flavivirga algicola]|uniref:Uncharacterized protein n=1 Tax=Flavivirga algicola TaxID=2729136 RepID=A0ABX1S3P5_9FLAO|nr:hypothetical protein [Flavivirga algicola]NMH89059.1 hypothetical protein [Flavivirga algicola]